MPKATAYADEPLSDIFETRADFSTIGAVTVTDPQSFNLDDFVGFTFRGKEIFDLDAVIQQIDSGNHNSGNGGQITYGFLKDGAHLTGLYNNPTLGFTAGDGVKAFSDAQKAEARQSIQFWDDLIAPKFVEKNGNGADIKFANSADPAQAYAYYPVDQGWKFQSDVFVADPELNWTNNWLGFNGYGATTLIHEIGHTIGLSHPGAYNFAPGIPLTYLGLAEYAQDSEQYSIMSYWAPAETGAQILDFSTFLFGNAQTPMLHDILTVQSIYGADPTTRTGDTVYGFNSNAGRDVFDFSSNAFPNVSIYDAGGNDTIDLSGFNASVFLDLHDGAFSSGAQAAPAAAIINANRAALTELADGAQVFAPLTQAQVDNTINIRSTNHSIFIAGDTGVSGVRATAYDNLSIAYGTVIENGVGGSQRDVLWGNEADNKLDGRAGDDVIDGFEGKDTLTGGLGADIFNFHNLEVGDRITDFLSGTDRISLVDTGVDFTFIGAAAFGNVAGELRFASGVLSGDVNGDGVADIAITVQGSGVVAGDLIII